MSQKLRLAVFKFASCDGCQLSLLNAEDELLALAEQVEIAHFAEASSLMGAGPFDIALVEGSITTAHDAERIQQVRQSAKTLITIGACATSGGIQALRNWGDHEEFLRIVYPRPEYIESLATSTPISAHVPVDFELQGCPVNTGQLVGILADVLHQRQIRVPNHSVCRTCKLQGVVCVAVARGVPCLGPITQAGCGALCPRFDRGCYGCFGPVVQANAESLTDWLVQREHQSPAVLVPLLRNFNAQAPAFQASGDRLAAGEMNRGDMP
ncbi:MAG: oxidoreductase [Planctomycetaceae bacterium]|nr:oxidoreductase [Planctomycetaceae bacterium]